MADSLIETVLARDVLQPQTVATPALLRHLFALSAAHYLRLLDTAFLVSGLELFSRGQQRKRGSSPKLALWNQALVNALAPRSFEEAQGDAGWWDWLVENAIGAHLVNRLPAPEWGVTYWRRGSAEVDCVVERGRLVWGLEVKSGRARPASGLPTFCHAHPRARVLLLGSDGIPIDEFLGADPRQYLEGGA